MFLGLQEKHREARSRCKRLGPSLIYFSSFPEKDETFCLSAFSGSDL